MTRAQFIVLAIILISVGAVMLYEMWKMISRARKIAKQNTLEAFDGDEAQAQVAMMAFKTGKPCVGEIDEDGSQTITVVEDSPYGK